MKRLVPELSLADPKGAADRISHFLGADIDRAGDALRLTLGDQQLLLRAGTGAPVGPVHHVAFAVPDATAALAWAETRGAARDTEMTPDGVTEIPEFWERGVRVAFLQGPEGTRLELCAGRRAEIPDGLGHDHVGVLCTDLAATRATFLDAGLHEVAAVTLARPEGATQVAFLAYGDQLVELFQPPGPVPVPGPFTALRLEGAGQEATLPGPGGLRLVLST